MKRHVPIMAALLAVSACADSAPTAPAAATPTVRLAAVPGRPAAGYFELGIDGERGALVSVSSPQAGSIEMHETMTSGNMSSMRPVRRIPVRAGDRLSFAPGGRHLMLFDVDPALRPGGRIDLTFRFERGSPITLAATVASAGGETH